MMCKIAILIVFGIVAVTISAGKKEMKCEPSERQMEIVIECFKEVTNRDLKSEEDFKGLDESAEEEITMCAFKKEGIVDEHGFNVEKAEESIRDLKASEETKEKLVESLKKCGNEHETTKVEAMLECLKETDMICEEYVEK